MRSCYLSEPIAAIKSVSDTMHVILHDERARGGHEDAQ